MKRLLALTTIIIVMGLFGCNQANNNKHQEMMDANSAVVKAIETGDKATLEKYISSDAVDHGGNPAGGDLKGEELINMLANVHNDIDNLKMEIEQQAANDEYIFSLVRMTGTTNKPVWGMPANFKMDSKSIDMLRIKDMKMTDHWTYMEPAEMMKMMQNMPMDGGHMMGDTSNMMKDTMMH